MNYRRTERLNSLMRDEVSDIIRSKIKDPRIGFVTVTYVDVTDDLKLAKVYISVLGNEIEKEKSVEGLKSASGFIRRELKKRLRIRYTPALTFCYDGSIEYGDRMNRILKKLQGEKD